jgi:hypothetical protein
MKKHDCQKTQSQFAEWLFAESVVEFEDCEFCAEQFSTLKNSLGQFDQAFSKMMPEENYWSGYEAKLWTKLAAEKTVSSWQLSFRLARWILPVAACLVLILLTALNFSAVKKQNEKTSDEAAQQNVQTNPDVQKVSDAPKSNPKKQRDEKLPKEVRKESVRPLNKKPRFLFDPNPIQASMDSEALVAPETALTTKHFEQAQMLLRAFRNSRETEQSTYDLSYEKNRSRRLLYENILLRREAEARGDWSMEEVLNHLEPLLLDIANLPERATADDVNPIKERMQKQEIVAKLQFYAMPVMSLAVAD